MCVCVCVCVCVCMCADITANESNQGCVLSLKRKPSMNCFHLRRSPANIIIIVKWQLPRT